MATLPVVDDHERNRIREALVRYKRAQGDIGDPELHQRMMYVLKCLDAQLPLSTLQRFLRGKHRTADAMVRKYKAFLSQVPDVSGFEKLGESLVTFFAHEAINNVFQKPDPRVASRYARKYRVYLRGARKYLEGTDPIEHPDFPIIDDPWSYGPYEIHYATLEFRPVPDSPFVRVIERVYNPTRDPLLTEISILFSKLPQEVFEGVATMGSHESITIVVLRSLGGLKILEPRFYLLENTDGRVRADAPLLGSCLTVTAKAPGASLCQGFQVKLFPVPDETEAKVAP
jgi:hypothetical protein